MEIKQPSQVQDIPPEKHSKDVQQSIPTPVTASRGPSSTSVRSVPLRRWVFVLFSLAFWAVVFRALRNRVGGHETPPSWTLVSDANERPSRGHRRFINGKRAEHIFLSVPNNDSAIAASRQFASKPHMAGTPGDLDTAIDFLALLQKELGIMVPPKQPIFGAGTVNSRNSTLSITNFETPQAWIDVYYPVLNTPLDRSVEILGDDGKVVWKAELEEVSDDMDPDAEKYSTAVPTFHGLSHGGEVQGKLIYANYGKKEDYDALTEAGVDFNGSIVITRYGGIFRGLKIKGAQERGAVGVLVYSDPRDDGSVTPSNGYVPYPQGPARNPSSVQRGSVQYISIYPGDPTTPGYPSYQNSTRTEGENIPSIPSLPISWNNAHQLLKEISEGGKNRTVKLVNHVNDKVTPIWNVMGVIPGHIKDEVVVVGNHRDAWVLGATDPSSGTVSTHEVIRGLGVLIKKGWKPLRTIVIASWDAEEYGLIGSTEWGEDFPEWIEKHVVAYLNLDSSVSGSRFRASASPSLAHLVRGAAQDVPHPTIANKTLWDARHDSGTLFGHVDPDVQEMYDLEHGVTDQITDGLTGRSEATGVGPLGSGSDYTVFLQRIGVASANGGFGSTLSDPVYHYHSVFDSETWQERYGDPGFHRHVAVAKQLGLQILRLADAIVLPLNTTQYAYDLDGYLDKVEDIANSQELDADFSALRQSIAKLQEASGVLDVEKAEAEENLKTLMRKWRRSRRCHKHPTKKMRRLRRKLREIGKKIRKWLGRHKEEEYNSASETARPSRLAHLHRDEDKSQENSAVMKPRVGRFPAWLKEQQEKEHGHKHEHHGHPHRGRRSDRKLAKKIARAAMRVRDANRKLVAFERGFISESGIKDRDWYKHLAVAPGKWLGYGATTFPALTESLTLEKNLTMAQYEAGRLKSLIDALRDEIKV